MLQKDADRMANSVDPTQTAPLGLHLSSWKLRIITVAAHPWNIQGKRTISGLRSEQGCVCPEYAVF